MPAKKLEDQSKYDAYDMDDDGIVSDAEMARAKEIRETEDALRKHLFSQNNYNGDSDQN